MYKLSYDKELFAVPFQSSEYLMQLLATSCLTLSLTDGIFPSHRWNADLSGIDISNAGIDPKLIPVYSSLD